MTELAFLRQIYGSVYVTALPDGRHIPWKPLSIKDYLEFEHLRTMETYTPGQLEDDIFRKCVLDSLIVERIDQLKAGTVSTVAAAILAASGPETTEELNYALQANRALIQGAIHQIVSMICQAFSGYTPEDVYEMDYATLMQRAALAEDKLLRTGIIPEKMSFEQGEAPQQPARTELNSKQLFERFEQQQGRSPSPPDTKQTIISTGDIAEAETAYTGHERSDKILRETQMINETVGVYGDYVEQMKKGEKVVIPSHEERVRAAKARAEENEKKYKTALKSKPKGEDEEEMQKLLKIREKARARKARKRR